MRLHLIAKTKSSKLKLTPTKLSPKRRPKKDYFGGRMKDLHIDIVDTIEALRSYLEHMETEPETPENCVKYEKAFETKMDLEGMLEGRVPLDIQVVKDAKETYNSEESFERAVEEGYEESHRLHREGPEIPRIDL